MSVVYKQLTPNVLWRAYTDPQCNIIGIGFYIVLVVFLVTQILKHRNAEQQCGFSLGQERVMKGILVFNFFALCVSAVRQSLFNFPCGHQDWRQDEIIILPHAI